MDELKESQGLTVGKDILLGAGASDGIVIPTVDRVNEFIDTAIRTNSPFEPGTGDHSAVLRHSYSVASGKFAVAEGAADVRSFSSPITELTNEEKQAIQQYYGTAYEYYFSGDLDRPTPGGNIYVSPDYEKPVATITNSVFCDSEVRVGDRSIFGVLFNATGETLTTGVTYYCEFGDNTIYNHASGDYSHVEGYANSATGGSSHAEGYRTEASGNTSHSEGYRTQAEGEASHVEGIYATAAGSYSHAEGHTTKAYGETSHAEGRETIAVGLCSHAEGYLTRSISELSHAEGRQTFAIGRSSHAEGVGVNVVYPIAQTVANNLFRLRNVGDPSTIFKKGDVVGISQSNVSGPVTFYAYVLDPHVSTSSGYAVRINRQCSFAWEAVNMIKIGNAAFNEATHTEGGYTVATGAYSHAEGYYTSAMGETSHAEGIETVTSNDSEHAEGQYNVSNKMTDSHGSSGNTQHSVGIGASKMDRKNAIEIMQNGDVYVYGINSYDGTNPSPSKTLQKAITDISDLTQSELDYIFGEEGGGTYISALYIDDFNDGEGGNTYAEDFGYNDIQEYISDVCNNLSAVTNVGTNIFAQTCDVIEYEGVGYRLWMGFYGSGGVSDMYALAPLNLNYTTLYNNSMEVNVNNHYCPFVVVFRGTPVEMDKIYDSNLDLDYRLVCVKTLDYSSKPIQEHSSAITRIYFDDFHEYGLYVSMCKEGVDTMEEYVQQIRDNDNPDQYWYDIEDTMEYDGVEYKIYADGGSALFGGLLPMNMTFQDLYPHTLECDGRNINTPYSPFVVRWMDGSVDEYEGEDPSNKYSTIIAID